MMASVEDKENASEVDVINLDEKYSAKKDCEAVLCPPKKKLKQEAIPFIKLKNEDSSGIDSKQDSAVINIEEIDTIESTKMLCSVAVRSIAEKQLHSITAKNSSPEKSAKNQLPIPVSSHDSGTPKMSLKETLPGNDSLSARKAKEKKSDRKLSFPKLSKEDALKQIEEESKMLVDVNGSDEENRMDAITETVSTPSTDKAELTSVPVKSSQSSDKVELTVTPIKIQSLQAELTPTPLKTPQSSEKKKSPKSKEERQRLKEEKEILKAARLKEIEEKRKKKEEEILLKQAEKERREHERKEKERLREEEKRKKEEERKMKEEEKRKKEEMLKAEKEKREAERLKKEFEKKIKEDQKRQEEEKKKQEDDALKKKKEKEANQFLSFFTKKNISAAKPPIAETYDRFKPFQIKPNMSLAPLVRKNKFDKDLLDNTLDNIIPEIKTYLKEQAMNFEKNNRKNYITRRFARHELEEQRKLEAQRKAKSETHNDSFKDKHSNEKIDIIVIEDKCNNEDSDENEEEEEDTSSVSEKNLYTAKLLQFSENTRPAYYGTWRKKSSSITGRRPFAVDNDLFNYEIDSDEEWIDEPGENLSDVADEDDEEENETEDDQDGFFVPHGYLSDDEGIRDESYEDNDEDAIISQGPDKNEEEKLKMKVCSFERGFRKTVKHRKPVCFGITYNCEVETMNPIFKEYMKVKLFKPIIEREGDDDMEVKSPPNTPKNSLLLPVPEEAMPFLIRFVHGNVSGLTKIVNHFRAFWSRYAVANELSTLSTMSKNQLNRKIHTIATRIQSEEFGKVCYVVSKDMIEKYNVGENQLKEGLPDLISVENTSISHDIESKIKNNDTVSKGDLVDNVVRVDTPMEICT